MSKLDEVIAELFVLLMGWNMKNYQEVASVSIGEFVHKNKQNPKWSMILFIMGELQILVFMMNLIGTANKIIIKCKRCKCWICYLLYL